MQQSLTSYYSTSKSGVARPAKDVTHMGAAVAKEDNDLDKPNPFDILPIEMNQRIAEFLPDDRSIAAFLWVSRSTRDAIEGNGRTFWRCRFLASFERPSQSKTNNEYKAWYLDRRLINFHLVTFTSGKTQSEQKCLEAIRDIIVDSFSGAPADAAVAYESDNIAHIYKIIEACPSLLSSIFDPRVLRPQHRRRGGSSPYRQPDRLLQTIQVLLTPHLLDIKSELISYGFPDSQRAAYVFKNIFKGFHPLDVDMEWVLHQVNFWRYHMLREEEATLFQAYCDLDNDEYPRYWKSQLKNDAIPNIGRFWKGSYSYIEAEEVIEIRRMGNDSGMIQDAFCGAENSGQFQDLELELLDNSEATWPPLFEHYLKARGEPEERLAKTRAQKRTAGPEMPLNWESRSFRFGGGGDDQNEPFVADGWFNPLPSQSGVPGWQRMTMMKYFVNENDEIDYNQLWAYEGVVLPGGKIIVGRWWNPADTDELYSGPFILWNVDTPELLRQHEEAMTED